VETSAGPTAGVAGTRRSGTVPDGDGGEGALCNGDGGVDVPLGGKARGGMGASRARDAGEAASCRVGSSRDPGARFPRKDGGEGGEKQPSS
jgi:hypothetical protein